MNTIETIQNIIMNEETPIDQFPTDLDQHHLMSDTKLHLRKGGSMNAKIIIFIESMKTGNMFLVNGKLQSLHHRLAMKIDQVPLVDLSQPPNQSPSQDRGQGPSQDLIPGLNHDQGPILVLGHVHQLHDHRLTHVQDLQRIPLLI